MLRVLLSPRWLGALVLAAFFAAACVALGFWQWGRYEDKSLRAELVRTSYAADPVPLDSALPAGAPPLNERQVWTRVVVDGRYDPAKQQLVRNRPQKVTYGYEVLVPLVLQDGSALLVDRGWVPNAERADVTPEVPPAPQGSVRVTGWLRQGEESLDRDMPTGQLASIDLAAAERATGYRLRPAYLVLGQEQVPSGATPPRPQALIEPDTDLGPHFAYALQWWFGAPLGFVLVGVYARREFIDSLPEEDPRRLERARREQAPKKKRIWDEEDE
ncbi:SURF1 family cytochrome oxidase biogenesis protein [Gephyromycinifex aptenodytis]|uniref:SURF1 family cytochrome oxidase biogenesis protein n=1 Tax=Gephyromycinifex aptenodytis TaxID=2716227 RepID=UPI001446C9C3|nr:SURF1 family protein [Gephyromycinifex aptenodytis]